MRRLKKIEKLVSSREHKQKANLPSKYAAYSDTDLKKELDKILRDSIEYRELEMKMAGFTECQKLEIYALFCQGVPLDSAIRAIRG